VTDEAEMNGIAELIFAAVVLKILLIVLAFIPGAIGLYLAYRLFFPKPEKWTGSLDEELTNQDFLDADN
jgi:hypothetical protein